MPTSPDDSTPHRDGPNASPAITPEIILPFSWRRPCPHCGGHVVEDPQTSGPLCRGCGAWDAPDTIQFDEPVRCLWPSRHRPSPRSMLDLDLPRAVPQRLRDRAAIEAHAAVAACTALDVNRLPPHALAALLAASASLTMRIAARMALSATTEPENTPRTAPRAEQFISVRAAATRLATEPKWLYRRQEHLPFMRQLSPGRWRVSVTALETWMRARRRPLTVP